MLMKQDLHSQNLLPEESDYLLLASPGIINDTIFDRSCVMITKSDKAHGHEGVVLNKSTTMTFKDFYSKAAGSALENTIVHLGGPVEPDALFLIAFHFKADGSLAFQRRMKIEDAIELESQKLEHLKIIPFIGYSAWQPEQLQNEIKNEYWAIHTITPSLKVSIWNESLWKTLFSEISPYHKLLSESPLNMRLN